jgi:hypothetical protein
LCYLLGSHCNCHNHLHTRFLIFVGLLLNPQVLLDQQVLTQLDQEPIRENTYHLKQEMYEIVS